MEEQIGILKEDVRESEAHSFAVSELRVIPERGLKCVMLPVIFRNTLLGIGVEVNRYFSVIFIADRPYQIISATERHQGAATAGTPALSLRRCTDGTSLAGGTSVSTQSWDMTASVNVNREIPIDVVSTINDGDSLGLTPSDTTNWSDVQGVTVQVLLRAL